MEGGDLDLIRAFQDGDRREEAFEALYYRYRDWVHSIAFRFCASREDALDVLQETFAYFYRRLPGLELTSRLTTFLYPVVKHLALNRRRGANRTVPLADLAAPDPASGHAEDLLAGLPQEQREIVWLRFVDEMDLKDIAEILGIPLGTVKSRLFAALQALRTKA
jgi:RNA polymerase sigma-70 factor (ECF subfamily)